jgi:hypothetical protein
MSVEYEIRGIQEAQNDNAKRIAALKPQGELGQQIKDLTTSAHRYAISITHVLTGSLRASHRMEVKGLRGRIYLDPGAVNPRSKQKPSIYGYYENRRGGEHAFYDRTVDEYADKAEDAIFKVVDK